MAAGYTIYQGAASSKWCVVELPDAWTRDDALPQGQRALAWEPGTWLGPDAW